MPNPPPATAEQIAGLEAAFQKHRRGHHAYDWPRVASMAYAAFPSLVAAIQLKRDAIRERDEAEGLLAEASTAMGQDLEGPLLECIERVRDKIEAYLARRKEKSP